MNQPRTIAVTGASGFVGSHLLAQMAKEFPIIRFLALSRSEITYPGLDFNRVTWRKADLFSAQSTAHALEGADTAIFLVHSMIPSSELFQGNFHDTDLLIADNFARACLHSGVKHIIYLGGILPQGHVSVHLQSRNEVEGVLRSTGIPVTVLRAGMIVGPGGSSFEILKSLVLRLPIMLLPKWTERITQVVFIDDILRIIQACILDPDLKGKTYDVVTEEKLTYRNLLLIMSQVLNRNRYFLRIPIHSTGFSKLWVTLFGNSNYALVSPLIDSLICDLTTPPPDPKIKSLIQYKSFEKMAKESINREGTNFIPRPSRKIQFEKSVRSIQRLPAIPEKDSDWIAQEYMRWLPKVFRSLIRVRVQENSGYVEFRLFLIPKPLLILQYITSSIAIDRQKFHIIGGLLTKSVNTGWLEFRQLEDRKYTLSAIHEFIPALPWYIYVCTQAPLHALVMYAFGRHLKKLRFNADLSSSPG
jgi:uncharacterized protein YbjT (DUF2867 family)